MVFCITPQHFDWFELTVEFRQEQAHMAMIFKIMLQQQLLICKIILQYVYSQKIFGYKFTGYGTTATTIALLNHIQQMYQMPEIFMAGGKFHFAGHTVREWCQENGSQYQQIVTYSPWVNRLLKGTNGKLLSCLK
jgi:hypothetical protein